MPFDQVNFLPRFVASIEDEPPVIGHLCFC